MIRQQARVTAAKLKFQFGSRVAIARIRATPTLQQTVARFDTPQNTVF
jgi:hypothetical protein